MGSLFSGYVFRGEPDVEKLKALDSSIGWNLYKHVRDAFWLLDVFPGGKKEHWPFADFISKAKGKHLGDVLPKAMMLAKTLASHEMELFDQELGWLCFSQDLSKLLGQELFCFISDDDSFGITAVFDSGQAIRVHRDLECLDVVFEEGQFILRPKDMEEDPELKPSKALLAKLGALEKVHVGKPLIIPGGGQWPNQIVIDDWPKDAGDVQTLGISEGFPELEFDFSLAAKATPKDHAAAAKQQEPRRGLLARVFGWGQPRPKAPKTVGKPVPMTGSQIAAWRLESVERELENIARFEREGNRPYLVLNLHSICEDLLIYGLHTYDRPEEASSFIKERGGAEFLKKALRAGLEEAEDRVKRGLPLGGPISGTSDIDAHLAWFIGEYDCAREIILACEDPRREYLADKNYYVWKYLEAMKCFSEKTKCDLDTSSGFAHAYPLLPACAVLMADLASGRPWEDSLLKVDQAWARLNANLRVESFQADGDGQHPVKWNFRRASIAAYARQFYGIEFPAPQTEHMKE